MKKILILTISIVLFCLNSNAKTLAYWRFEEGTNEAVHTIDLDGYYKDSSGCSNDLSSWNYPAPVCDVLFPVIPQTGMTNERALNFMRNDLGVMSTPNGQYLETSDGAPIESYDFSGGFTIECIVKPRVYAWMKPISKDGKPIPSSDLSPFYLMFREDNWPDPKIEFFFFDGNSIGRSLESSFGYELNKWYCIAMVFDGSSAFLYIKEEDDDNYQLEASITSINGMLNVVGKWSIGRGMYAGVKTDNLYGTIDEVRIVPYALNTNQFLASGNTNSVIPLAYWRFEEGTNGIHQTNNDGYYVDSSGNSNDMSTSVNVVRTVATNNVPFEFIPVTDQTNLMARKFSGTADKPDNNIGTFGAETTPKSIESAALTNFTVECMAKPLNIDWMCSVSKDGIPGWLKNHELNQLFAIKFEAAIDGTNSISAAFYDANTNLVKLATSWSYETGIWYQIAVEYQTNTAFLYIKREGEADYVLEDVTTTSSSAGHPPISGGLLTQTYPWTIGRGMHGGIARDGFSGIIDEVRISDTALPVELLIGSVPEPFNILFIFNLIIIYLRKIN